ncbi:hypothetical cytosolic protein [Syntrophus aciditrophicus SB]|uniref:Hypothetical cytosolic protein n=1 Tax=Syntrophus aciditrophicus (strain SB) TaxID=56780 RepID=Q2LUT9_SYNAS|nr:hypothetical cytosolic protein [Syntrophus aciditrophicus SB]
MISRVITLLTISRSSSSAMHSVQLSIIRRSLFLRTRETDWAEGVSGGEESGQAISPTEKKIFRMAAFCAKELHCLMISAFRK